MIDLAVRRAVELATPADQLWRLLTDPAEVGSWLGGDVRVAFRPGAEGRIVDLDGTVRRVVVDSVDPGRAIGFTWWVDGDPAGASTVALRVEARPAVGDGADGDGDGAAAAERSVLTVVERPVAIAGGRTCQASAATWDAAWDDRLVGLELALLTRGALVLAV